MGRMSAMRLMIAYLPHVTPMALVLKPDLESINVLVTLGILWSTTFVKKLMIVLMLTRVIATPSVSRQVRVPMIVFVIKVLLNPLPLPGIRAMR